MGEKQVYSVVKGCGTGMGICIYIWNVATESEVADTIGSTATTRRVARRQPGRLVTAKFLHDFELATQPNSTVE